jgi:hypothetical protein
MVARRGKEVSRAAFGLLLALAGTPARGLSEQIQTSLAPPDQLLTPVSYETRVRTDTEPTATPDPICGWLTSPCESQRDVGDLINGILDKPPNTTPITPEQTAEFRVLFLPAFSVAPTTGLLLGISTTASFGIGTAPGTEMSVIRTSVFYTSKSQFGLQSFGAVYAHDNQLTLQADWRYLITSQPTYGLGSVQPTANLSNMNFDLLRFKQVIMKEMFPGGWYLGGGYDYDGYLRIDDKGDTAGNVTPFLAYNHGQPVIQTVATGPEIAGLHDSRDNPINPLAGRYTSINIGGYPTFLGSSSDWATLVIDHREYLHPATWWPGILAVRNYDWLTVGRAPYMELPSIGWDRDQTLGRGYPQGRLRGNQMLYLEGEERAPLTPNGLLGLTLFFNVSAFSNPATNQFKTLNTAGGVGLRLKFDKATDNNVRFDFGWGRSGSHGVYLGLGEAF